MKTFLGASTNVGHTLIVNVYVKGFCLSPKIKIFSPWWSAPHPPDWPAWASYADYFLIFPRLGTGPGPELWCHVLSGQERAPSLPGIRSGLWTLQDNTTQSDLSPLCSGFNLQLALSSPPPIPVLSFCSNKLGSPVSPVSLKTLNFN